VAGALDGNDPQTRAMLLDLFTEIAILEHLTRERFTARDGSLDPRQFGVINYFVRLAKVSERLPTLAWCFQVDDAAMLITVEALAERGLVTIDPVDGEPCIFITAAGRARHDRFLDEAAPDVLELLSDVDPDALRVTTETLKEIRRTFDNLPDR